jgi:hypothetical protein
MFKEITEKKIREVVDKFDLNLKLEPLCLFLTLEIKV